MGYWCWYCAWVTAKISTSNALHNASISPSVPPPARLNPGALVGIGSVIILVHFFFGVVPDTPDSVKLFVSTKKATQWRLCKNTLRGLEPESPAEFSWAFLFLGSDFRVCITSLLPATSAHDKPARRRYFTLVRHKQWTSVSLLLWRARHDSKRMAAPYNRLVRRHNCGNLTL